MTSHSITVCAGASAITRPDEAAYTAARERQSTLTKPPGALGRLEDMACWFAARQGRAIPVPLTPAITVFAADHGVAAQGVSAFPASVTTEMVKNFLRGGAAINALGRHAGASVTVVDVGVNDGLAGMEGLINAKVRWGTADLSIEPAMTRAEAEQAMAVGAARVRAAIEQGANVLIAGEMGIGNTTASACLICGLTGASPGAIVGAGTGLDAAGVTRKAAIVQRALDRVHRMPNVDPIDLLAEVGGLEIAAMAGYYLAAARAGTPCILDGFIAAAAALVARAIDPAVTDWLLASHCSAELGHAQALQHLGLTPLLDWQLRLGEGSGAALLLPLLQAALRLHAEMATFAQAGVSTASSR